MSWMQALHMPSPPPVERRSEAQINSDLDDEFAFHMGMKARQMMGEGMTSEAAMQAARLSFGDVSAIKDQCRRLALQERIMLQRVNFVMMIIVMIMVVGVGVQVIITQRYNTLALQAITADLARMKFEDAAARRAEPPPPSADGGMVYLDGAVERPGAYALPTQGSLTLKRLIASAGGIKLARNGSKTQKVSISNNDGEGADQARVTIEDLVGSGEDPVLRANDHIVVQHVAPVSPAPGERAATQPRIEDALANLPALPRRDGPQYAKLSPFRAVRWKEWTPFVNVNNTWGELVSINDIPVSVIIDHGKRAHPGRERKRFTEDLVQLLTEMDKPPGQAVKVEIKDLRTGTVMSVGEVPMSEANRDRLREANNAVEHGEPGFPEWTGQPPDPLQEMQSRRSVDEPAARATLSGEQAKRDIDELEKSLRGRFSYLRLRGEELEPLLNEMRTSFASGARVSDFAVAVHRLVCRFGDGHAGVQDVERFLGGAHAPFLVQEAEGRLIAFHPDRSGFIDPAHPVLRSVNGVAVEQLMELAAELTAQGSPALVRQRSLGCLRSLEWLLQQAGAAAHGEVTLELASLDGAATRETKLPLSQSWPTFGPWPRRASGIMDGDIGYLRLASMDQEAADAVTRLMSEFSRTVGLVIDVRGNGGGTRDVLLALLPYLLPPGSPPQVVNVAAYRLNSDFPEDHLAARFLFRRNDGRWSAAEQEAIDAVASSFAPCWKPPDGEFSEWHYMVVSPDRALVADPALFHYDHPVVVLMDGGCFSATDIFLGAVKRRPNVTLLGTPSGGGSGRVQVVRLPNSGISVRLSSMISFMPDGSMYDLSGITPDVHHQPIATDFIGTTDSPLDAALGLIRAQGSRGPDR